MTGRDAELEDDEVMDQRRVDHLQNLLEQATKGIVAMAAKKGATGADKSGRMRITENRHHRRRVPVRTLDVVEVNVALERSRIQR